METVKITSITEQGIEFIDVKKDNLIQFMTEQMDRYSKWIFVDGVFLIDIKKFDINAEVEEIVLTNKTIGA